MVGGHGNAPEKQHIKASQRRSSGVVRKVSRVFRVNPSSPSNISLKCVREYWLDGLDTLCSPLFDALCYRCGQLLWGPIGGGHKFTVPRNTGEIRTQTLFGVPPTDLGTSGIFVFHNEMFANYLNYKTAPFPVPPQCPAQVALWCMTLLFGTQLHVCMLAMCVASISRSMTPSTMATLWILDPWNSSHFSNVLQ